MTEEMMEMVLEDVKMNNIRQFEASINLYWRGNNKFRDEYGKGKR